MVGVGATLPDRGKGGVRSERASAGTWWASGRVGEWAKFVAQFIIDEKGERMPK